jgi:thioredoxin-like negative regulator of GroEL
VGELKLLYFTAPWCGTCKTAKPFVESVASCFGYALRVIDVDQEPDLAVQYGVMSLPTVVLVDPEGRDISRLRGSVTTSGLRTLLEERRC